MNKEADLARAVVRWAQANHWDVYQEVRPGYGWPVADIVIVLGDPERIWVVECKMNQSMALLNQAVNWTQWANMVSVAVPHRCLYPRTGKNLVPDHIKRYYKIGSIYVEGSGADMNVGYNTQPGLHRKSLTKYIRQCLTEDQKTFAEAGNNRGEYWTPFRQTCLDVRRYVEKHPGTKIKPMIDELGAMHYASKSAARSSLSKWIQSGVVKGVYAEREGRAFRLYPTEKIKEAS